MKKTEGHSGLGLTAAVMGAFALNASMACADLYDCRIGIEKAASKYESAITKALQDCTNAVGKEEMKTAAKAGSGSLAAAAETCETVLSKIYGIPSVPKPFIGKTAVQKFRDACNKLRTGTCKSGGTSCTTDSQCIPGTVCQTTCRDEDLAMVTSMGHLLSGSGVGANAPPSAGDPGKFACDWILVAEEKVAIKQQLLLIPDTMALLAAAVKAAPEGISLKTGKAGKKGTSCSVILANVDPLTHESRPNLCRLGPECSEHVCMLASSSHAAFMSAPLLGLFGGPVPFDFGGGVTLELCKLPGPSGQCFDAPHGPCTTDADCPVSATNKCGYASGMGAGNQFGAESDFLYLIGEPSRATKVSIPPVLTGVVAAVCMNEVRSEGWCDCTGHGVNRDTNFCIDQWTGDNVGTDDCAMSTSAQTPSVLYPGSFNGALKVTPTGPSVAGDCFDLQTTQLKFLLTTTDFGTDGVPCTTDDSTSFSVPVQLPLTTGTAVASIKDAVRTPGFCNASGRLCIEDRNCRNFCSGPAGSCEGTGAACTGGPNAQGSCAVDTPCSGPMLTNIQVGPITGTKTSCAQYQTSNLSGLSLVGAFPVLGTDLTDPLADRIQSFKLTCN